MSKETLNEALKLADSAVELETAEKYEESITCYAKAIDILDAVEKQKTVSPPQRDVIQRSSTAYKERIGLLVDVLILEKSYFTTSNLVGKVSNYKLALINPPRSSGEEMYFVKKMPKVERSFAPEAFGIYNDSFNVQFVEEPTPKEDPETMSENPSSPVVCFFVVKKLKQSITDGAWITQRIFITSSVWKFPFTETKNYIHKETIVKAIVADFLLLVRASPNRHFFRVKYQMDQSIEKLEKLNKDIMQKHINADKSANVMKSILNIFSSGKAVNPSIDYVTYIQQMLDMILLLEKWHKDFLRMKEQGIPLMDRLKRILELLQITVLDMIIRDLGYIVDLQLKDGRTSFSRLFKNG